MNNTKRLLLIAAWAVLLMACSQKGGEPKIGKSKQDQATVSCQASNGDDTFYGLACEGCTDSTIVMLPEDGADPLKFNIIAATRNRRVLGKPKVGDWIGIMRNAEDSTVADLVIDLDELKGTWCYVVMPRLREQTEATGKLPKAVRDSLVEHFFIPREYGFTLKRHWAAQSVGYVQESSLGESPVVYPQLGFFTSWNIWNGQLVITSGKPQPNGEGSQMEINDIRHDTCRIDFLGHDSLVLSSDGISRSYYRNSDVKNINKKSKEMAAELLRQALDDIRN